MQWGSQPWLSLCGTSLPPGCSWSPICNPHQAAMGQLCCSGSSSTGAHGNGWCWLWGFCHMEIYWNYIEIAVFLHETVKKRFYRFKFANMSRRSISELRVRQQRERIHIHDLKIVFPRQRHALGQIWRPSFPRPSVSWAFLLLSQWLWHEGSKASPWARWARHGNRVEGTEWDREWVAARRQRRRAGAAHCPPPPPPGVVQKLPMRMDSLAKSPSGWSLEQALRAAWHGQPVLPVPGAPHPTTCQTGGLSPNCPSPKHLQIMIKPLRLWPKMQSGPLHSHQVSHPAHCCGYFLDFSISQHPPRSIAVPRISHCFSRANIPKEKSPHLERFFLLLQVGHYWFSKCIFIIGDRFTRPC